MRVRVQQGLGHMGAVRAHGHRVVRVGAVAVVVAVRAAPKPRWASR